MKHVLESWTRAFFQIFVIFELVHENARLLVCVVETEIHLRFPLYLQFLSFMQRFSLLLDSLYENIVDRMQS